MGWIFVKPNYERLALVDKEDLESDPVVRFQHKYYVPIALTCGLVAPTLIASLWGDALGGYLWGGVVARLLIWHCTFMINSLAHWDGLQLYSKEMSAKGNFLLAVMTSGEGNHNFVSDRFMPDVGGSLLMFPPACYSYYDWDPSKWIIYALHRWTPLVTSVKRAKDEDVKDALEYTRQHGYDHIDWNELKERKKDQSASVVSGPEKQDAAAARSSERDLREWRREDLEKWILQREKEMKETGDVGQLTLLIIDGWVVDASKYLKEHPGGASLLRKHCVPRPGSEAKKLKVVQNEKSASQESGKTSETNVQNTEMTATWAFNGGLNNHSRIAKEKMISMRIGRFVG
ncbi:hypothetical protein FRC03_006328 [Tulasnella sp. 419]|nr:hypothetical protein FRC03_006328 [Tulasnella sp. 419]